MSHIVTVRDPWFGTYLKVSFGGSWPTYFVGPLVERPLHVEGIWTSGRIAGTQCINEKVCRHTYVEGLITGDTSGDDPGIAVLSFSSGGFEYSTGTTIRYTYTVTHTVSFQPTAGTGSFSATCRRVRVMNGVTTVLEGGFTVSFKVRDDPVGGTRTYGPFVKGSNWGGIPANAYIVTNHNPYNTGGSDGLGGYITHIRGWISAVFLKFGSVGSHTALRNEAIWKAIEDLEVASINPLQDFNDLKEPLGIVSQLAKNLKVKNWQDAAKSAANLHLWWKYVVKTNILTVNETKKVISYLKGGAESALQRIASADMVGRGSASVTYDNDYGTRTVKIAVKAVYASGWSPFASIAKLRAIGVYPGVGDVWDMLPYSFVADWVLPIQENLDRADRLMDVMHLPLRYLVISTKVTDAVDHTFSAGTHTFTARLNRVSYFRKVAFSLPPDFGMGKLGFSNPLKHGLTGAALIIQRR